MDDEWAEPTDRGIERERLAVRLACAGVALLVVATFTGQFLADVPSALWPPTDPLGQWATLAFLCLFGYVVVPLAIGSFVADVVLERVG